MVDFTRLAETAKRLIDENGRSIKIIKLNQTPDDNAKPWRGNDNSRTSPADEIDTKGVFVDIAGLASLGNITVDEELIKRSEMFVILNAIDFGSSQGEDFEEVQDNNISWKIEGVRKLQPADTTVMYYMGLRK